MLGSPKCARNRNSLPPGIDFIVHSMLFFSGTYLTVPGDGGSQTKKRQKEYQPSE